MKEYSPSNYFRDFQTLRVDRTRGVAPHKPILLISILQSFRNGIIRDGRIYMTPELVALFKANWNLLVVSNHHCNISYPFYHLKSSGFWKLIPRTGFFDVDKLGSAIKSLTRLNEAVECAVINRDLVGLMLNFDDNILLETILLEEFFPSTMHLIGKVQDSQINIIREIESKILQESSSQYVQEIKDLISQKNDEEIFMRGGFFKREIPKIYNSSCCISGMGISSLSNISMVDACHVRPFSISFDDTISNGIALCPNLHRAFDRGLISIDENYRVLVSSSFTERDSPYNIKSFQKKEITLPSVENYYPSLNNLKWHRENVFIP